VSVFRSRLITCVGIIALASTLLCLAVNWLLQRVVAWVLIALVLLLAGCRTDIETPPPSRCHEAIAYVNYTRGACVFYEI